MMALTEERSAINSHHFHQMSRFGLILIVLMLAGCGRTPDTVDPTRVLPTGIPALTPLPPLPTAAPLGSEDNPVRVMIVVADEEASQDAADDLADVLSEEADMVIEVSVTESAPDARRALCNRTVHLVTLDAFNYLGASESNCGAPIYVVSRGGQTQTQGQFLGWTPFRPDQFRGVFCRPDSNSINGWIIPTLTLRASNVDMFTDMFGIVDAGSDEEVIRAIDTRKCDMGATALGAEQLVRDLNNPNSIFVLEELTPVPNPVVVVSTSADANLQTQLANLVTNHTLEIGGLMGGEGLIPASDTLFTDLRNLFEDADVDPSAMGE
jgi:ABC-type phosphate/phosphonate transport system substrate-binding protein